MSRRTIYRLAQAGKIRIVRITSDSPRVMRADLEAFLTGCGTMGPVIDDDAPDDTP